MFKKPTIKGRLNRLLFAGIVSLAVSGCSVFRQEYGRPVPETGQFIDGHTHYAEVLDELGPPAKLSATDGGMVFLYERAALTERQLGINISYEHIPILKIVVGRGNVEGETAVFLFDDAGTLMSHERDTWIRDLGRGEAVQFFISVMKVTSSAGYDLPPTTNLWGADLLTSRLPDALNRTSNLNTGQSGVEIKGTSEGVGQHTLKLRPTIQR